MDREKVECSRTNKRCRTQTYTYYTECQKYVNYEKYSSQMLCIYRVKHEDNLKRKTNKSHSDIIHHYWYLSAFPLLSGMEERNLMDPIFQQQNIRSLSSHTCINTNIKDPWEGGGAKGGREGFQVSSNILDIWREFIHILKNKQLVDVVDCYLVCIL